MSVTKEQSNNLPDRDRIANSGKNAKHDSAVPRPTELTPYSPPMN
jgi:hypothetical protein